MASLKACIDPTGCDRPVLRDLVSRVVPLATSRWYDLGLQLLDPHYAHELDSIEADTKDDNTTCCRKMFSKWLQTDVQASWDKVISSLRCIGLNSVASDIEELFLNTSHSSSTDDSFDELAAIERARKKSKSKEEGTKQKMGSSVVNWLSDFMKERYGYTRLKKQKEENDPWPPVKTKSYITLALMHQKDLRTSTEITQTIFLCTTGDIPATVNSQKLIDITQIFSPHSGRAPSSILIEGHPGIGKTTLVKEICVKWAEGKLLSSDKLVFLLLLRDPNVQKISNIQQLIEHFTKYQIKELYEYQIKELYQQLLLTHGANVALIIDGFDELSENLREESVFVKLIEKKILPKATIVVTSRPSASACLQHIVDRRIEILGFDQASRMEYVNEALKDSPSKLKKLQKHFQQYPNIDAICYIPLIMSIIVFLCMCQPEDLPPTATEMYHSFILHTICHYLKRRKEIAKDKHISKMEQLPQPVKELLKKMQAFAYCCLVEDKIVFTINDLPVICRGDPICYGLLQSVEFYSPAGIPTNSFNFLHLGIQEYFAANFVATLPEDDVYTLLKTSFLTSKKENNFVPDQADSASVRFSNMWIMYCGITSGQCYSLKLYLSRYMYAQTYAQRKQMQKYAQRKQMQKYARQHKQTQKYEHSIQSESLVPSCMSVTYALDYTYSHKDDDDGSTTYSPNNSVMSSYQDTPINIPSMPHIEVTSLPSCNWCEEEPIWLLSSIQANLSLENNPNSVIYRSRGHKTKASSECISNTSYIELQMASENKATQFQQGLTASNTFNISQAIMKDPLKVLYLFQCFQEARDGKLCDILSKLFDNGEIILIDHGLLSHQVVSLGFFILRSHKKEWKKINLRNCHIGDHGINLLHHYLCGDKTKNHVITNINLSHNYLTGASSLIVSDIITHFLPHTLKLGGNNITSVSDISRAVIITNTVKVLNMDLNGLTAQEALAISDMMTCLEELDISNNKLGDNGAVTLSEGITKTNTLRELRINSNNISSVGVMAIANSLLLHNTSLEKLDISYNDVDQDGATAIGRAIANNKTLKELKIGYSNITSIGTTAIANSLSQNNSLEVLDMRYNAVGHDGITAIIQAITNNKTLKELSLVGDDTITKESAMIIVKSLNTIIKL